MMLLHTSNSKFAYFLQMKIMFLNINTENLQILGFRKHPYLKIWSAHIYAK